MIVLISSRTKTFKFVNEYDSNDTSYYMVTVTVDEKMYISGKTYYDIMYDYTLYNKLDATPYFLDVMEAVFVLKNQMTEIMVNYLLSESEELVKVSGTSTAQHYRYLIMMNLSKLRD